VARAATHKVLVQLLWLDWPLEFTAALQHSYVGFLLLCVALCKHYVFHSILLPLVVAVDWGGLTMQTARQQSRPSHCYIMFEKSVGRRCFPLPLLPVLNWQGAHPSCYSGWCWTHLQHVLLHVLLLASPGNRPGISTSAVSCMHAGTHMAHCAVSWLACSAGCCIERSEPWGSCVAAGVAGRAAAAAAVKHLLLCTLAAPCSLRTAHCTLLS
jgi:hypothetical protein